MFKKHSNEKNINENLENTSCETQIKDIKNAENTTENSTESKQVWYKRVFEFLKNGIKTIKISEIIMCIVISWFMVFALEALGRHSVKTALNFMIQDFWFFLSNFSIILCSVTLCLFFKRR